MKANVLFIDDEQTVLRAIKIALAGSPYKMFTAQSEDGGKAILDNEDIHIIVCDLDLGKSSGLDFLSMCRENYPEIVRLVFTGFSSQMVTKLAQQKGEIFKFLTKPIAKSELLHRIQQAIEHYNQYSDTEITEI